MLLKRERFPASHESPVMKCPVNSSRTAMSVVIVELRISMTNTTLPVVGDDYIWSHVD